MARLLHRRSLSFDTTTVTIFSGPIRISMIAPGPSQRMASFPPALAIQTDSSGCAFASPSPALNGPVALHIDDLGVQPMTWQVFVNGQPFGGQGAFPPHPDPADPPVSPVMTLPSSLAPPGSMALVALREWYAPAFLESGVPSHPTAVIDEAGVLSLTVRARAAESLVANGPEYALSAALALAGVALLVFWHSGRGREYLWAAIMLLSPLPTAILSSGLVPASLVPRADPGHSSGLQRGADG